MGHVTADFYLNSSFACLAIVVMLAYRMISWLHLLTQWLQLVGAREARQWSQEKLAELLNVSPRTVQRWEAFRSSPTMAHMQALRKEFGEHLTHPQHTTSHRPLAAHERPPVVIPPDPKWQMERRKRKS